MQATARATLIELVQDHIAGLIRDALTVQHHAKRARLHETTADTPNNNSMQLMVDNNSNKPLLLRRRLHAADINMALQLQGSEKLYASHVVPPHGDATLQQTSAASSSTAAAASENKDASRTKVLLADFLRSSAERMPSAPFEIGYHMRWLAVDGQDPSAAAAANAKNKKRKRGDTVEQSSSGTTTTAAAAAAADNAASSASALRIKQLQSSLISEELQLYFSRVTAAVELSGATSAAARQQQDVVLQTVARDPGLQELVPFLVRYCVQEIMYKCGTSTTAETTTNNNNAAEDCRTLVRLAKAMLDNPAMHLELHLHELLPPLMTCIVAQQLPGGATKHHDCQVVVVSMQQHWALRREAAACLLQACDMFGMEYTTLKARVLRALCDAVAPGKNGISTATSTTTAGGDGGTAASSTTTTTAAAAAGETTTTTETATATATTTTTATSLKRDDYLSNLPTRYGGTVAISLFGSRAVDAFLLPSILDAWEEWEASLSDANNNNNKKIEIQMCQQASLDALSIFLQQVSPAEKAARVDRRYLEHVVGDRLVALEGEANEYAMCLV